MKQFILANEPVDDTVRLEGGDFRYLVRVRRLAVGEFFPALLPNGAETLVQVLSIGGGVLTGKCLPNNEAAPVPPETQIPPIVLFQAMPKGEKMDLIVRQAAEGGITEIVPFVSEFSAAKGKTGGQKYSRWERIIKEARQQSGSKIATSIRPPLAKDELFDYWKELKEAGAIGLLFHHPVRSQGLEQNSLHSYLNSIPQTLALAIGPEGGFSDNEVSLFLENGFKPLTIGDTILRTETAALYCAAAVRILLLEKNWWELKQVKTGSG
ncbi:MAG: 16S rRNA (uracil(1498)-N(3))-methyltransferase [Treponema sp.]|nr:16S rRNA (uracil(1498)-N(3))-methyltransferase [Treponema sp.]